MAEFASNTPISRPIKQSYDATWDLGGLSWSYDWGFFYQTADELIPIRLPSPLVSGKLAVLPKLGQFF
jgi:hypothetical protein